MDELIKYFKASGIKTVVVDEHTVFPVSTVGSTEVSDTIKDLWTKLKDILSNEQAWYIIMHWRQDEIKEALTQSKLQSAQVQDGMEDERPLIKDEEQAHQEVPEGTERAKVGCICHIEETAPNEFHKTFHINCLIEGHAEAAAEELSK